MLTTSYVFLPFRIRTLRGKQSSYANAGDLQFKVACEFVLGMGTNAYVSKAIS